ncbi:hypothetical protein GGH13_002040 [Coemansia sp. S155-1]|nr:hypothetical protein H4S03_002397 [Coemansia sp. S3946]KAJ2073385.1 hypothetical protein GGH13_002040 [Coemansia sp. S155-1]
MSSALCAAAGWIAGVVGPQPIFGSWVKGTQVAVGCHCTCDNQPSLQQTPTATRPADEPEEYWVSPSFPGLCPENVDPYFDAWAFFRPLAYSSAGGFFFLALLPPIFAYNQKRLCKKPSRVPKRRVQQTLPLNRKHRSRRILPLNRKHRSRRILPPGPVAPQQVDRIPEPEVPQPEAPIPGPAPHYTPVLPADGGYPLDQRSGVATAQVNEVTNIERHGIAFSELNRVTNGAYSHCRHIPQTTDGFQIYWQRGVTTMSLPPLSDCDTESCYSDKPTSESIRGEHYSLDEFGRLMVEYESTQSPSEVEQVYIPPDADLVAEQMRHEDLKLRFGRLWASIAAERNEPKPAPSATTEPIVEQVYIPSDADLVAEQMRHEDLKLRFVRLWASIAAERNEPKPAPSATTEPIVEQVSTHFEHESDRDSACEERMRDASKSIFSRLMTLVTPARDPPEPLPGEAVDPVVERASTAPSVGVDSQLLPGAPQPSDYAADGPSNRSRTPSSPALGELQGQESETPSAVPGRGAPQPPLEDTVGLGVGQDSTPSDSTPNDQAVPGSSNPNRVTTSSVPSNRREGKPKRRGRRGGRRSRRH